MRISWGRRRNAACVANMPLTIDPESDVKSVPTRTVPEHLSHLPIEGGLPLPIDSVAMQKFSSSHPATSAIITAFKLCTVCGRELAPLAWAVTDKYKVESKWCLSAQGLCHASCLEFSMRVCPFIGGDSFNLTLMCGRAAGWIVPVTDGNVASATAVLLHSRAGRLDDVELRTMLMQAVAAEAGYLTAEPFRPLFSRRQQFEVLGNACTGQLSLPKAQSDALRAVVPMSTGPLGADLVGWLKGSAYESWLPEAQYLQRFCSEVEPYDYCQCDSGKKSKWCHKNKFHEDNYNIGGVFDEDKLTATDTADLADFTKELRESQNLIDRAVANGWSNHGAALKVSERAM